MANDYKHRAQRSKPRKRDRRNKRSVRTWLAAGLLIALFVGFLVFLRSTTPPDGRPTAAKTVAIPTAPTKPTPESKPETARKKQPEQPESSAPRFDFYTILPQKEVVIPEHEVKTRAREKKPGSAKAHGYSLQAGSFRRLADADKRKAQLALLGIEARIETALVNGKQWNRVKIGPYPSMNRVDKVRSRLRENAIDVVVLNNKQ